MIVRRLLALGMLSCALVSAQVRITEFMASNDTGLEDENGHHEDWIELANLGSSTVDLDGWSLTDDPVNTQKWIFPAVSLAPGELLVVFASDKDRSVPGLPLHTNFSLHKTGEYLGLYEPGGATVAAEFSPTFPPQAPDVSYGTQQGISEEIPVTLGTPGRAGVPTSEADFNSQFADWETSLNGAFGGSSWQEVAMGVGYETNTGGLAYGGWIGTGGNVEDKMHDNNASVFIRVPFTVTNASEISTAALRMRWDDGFIAYLNGEQIGANKEPASPAWNSIATSTRNDSLNEDPTQFNIDLGTAPLNEGANLLAIHGLNRSAGSSDLLIQPVLILTRKRGASGTLGYFTTPTPGLPNDLGQEDLAPLFDNVTESAPTQPTGGAGSPPLLLTATVRAGTDPLSEVRAYYRTMFGPEAMVMLFDDGIAPDDTADDGLFSGEIPTHQVGPGEMLRWRFEATDTHGGVRSSPPYPDPLDADRCYGTVALDADLATAGLPVLQTFVENPSAVDTVGGDRVSLYYLGRFYDNIQMDRHGQSTSGFAKKSYDIDFNKGNRFKWKEDEGKVKDINLLTNWADKSKVRNTLAYEMLERAGVPHHYAFPVRVERNGSFFAVADLVEDADDRYLDRLGLDGDGALYKIYDKMVDVNTAGKKTRQEEDREDLQDWYDLVDRSLGTTQLRKNIYDHLNVAAAVNYIAANHVIGITDWGHKNYYWFRDTEGTGEWRPLPWDVDLSAGHHWGGTTERYFNDDMNYGIKMNLNNPLWRTLYETPEFQQMLARRWETLRREILQPNGTPAAQDWIRNRVIEIEASTNPPGIVSDSDLDFAAWGSWGDGLSSRPSAARIYNEWLPNHRATIFNPGVRIRGSAGTPIPSTQPATPNVVIDSIDHLPVSGTQEEEYVIIRNHHSSTLDLSGWTLSGAIEFTFPPGTVLLQGNGSSGSDYRGFLHVARNPAAFRGRATGPTGNEGRYVQGPSSGQLSARGETIILKNAEGTLIDQYTYPGTPTPAQLGLRITEINYNPANPTATELSIQPGLEDRDFEFVELMNIGSAPLDLSGAAFTEGIDFVFPAATSLASRGRLLLVKNPTAFALRYGDPGVPVFGPYSGLLENFGELLKLEDAVGENILEFSYLDSWYPDSDGGGASLVLRSTSTPYDQFGHPGSWGSSPESGGSPGTAGAGYRTHFNAWQAINYSPADREPGRPGHPDSDVDGDGLTTWVEYALGTEPAVPNPFATEYGSLGNGASTQVGLVVKRRRFTSDVQWDLLSSSSLSGFTPLPVSVETNRTTVSPVQESVLIHDPDPVSSAPELYYRLRVSPLPATP